MQDKTHDPSSCFRLAKGNAVEVTLLHSPPPQAYSFLALMSKWCLLQTLSPRSLRSLGLDSVGVLSAGTSRCPSLCAGLLLSYLSHGRAFLSAESILISRSFPEALADPFQSSIISFLKSFQFLLTGLEYLKMAK